MSQDLFTERRVISTLEKVQDPEIPVVSIVDLGMIHSINTAHDKITVELLPTYVACPATNIILSDATAALNAEFPEREVEVSFSFAQPWTTDRLAKGADEKLKELGISASSACPFCGETDSELISEFGPTPCRSAHFCPKCRNAFEIFKTKLRLAPAPGSTNGGQRSKQESLDIHRK